MLVARRPRRPLLPLLLALGLAACDGASPPPPLGGAPRVTAPATDDARDQVLAELGLDGVDPDDPAALRAHLLARRAENMARLREYAESGAFPRNRVREGRLNVFVDDDGHHCAVANLMRLDGEGELIAATARTDNFVRLRDVHEGPLVAWILTSGLTQEEIDRIQEPYFYIEEPDPPAERREDDRLKRHFSQVQTEVSNAEAASADLAVSRLQEWIRQREVQWRGRS